jgi:hypothetical protein
LGGTAKVFRPCKLISFAGAFSYFWLTADKASSAAETASCTKGIRTTNDLSNSH